MTIGQLTTADAVERFMLGGKATMTLVSERTGVRYTYRITKGKPNERFPVPATFVNLLAGPDNENDYVYMGMLTGHSLRLTAKSAMTDDSAPVKAFRYLLASLAKDDPREMPAQLQVFHEGRCCRCNRLLTVPSSIASGIGPECATKGY